MSQGKGHQRRPAAVPRATVDANYERTFREGQLPNLLRFEAERHKAVMRHIDALPEAQWIATPSDRTDARHD